MKNGYLVTWRGYDAETRGRKKWRIKKESKFRQYLPSLSICNEVLTCRASQRRGEVTKIVAIKQVNEEKRDQQMVSECNFSRGRRSLWRLDNKNWVQVLSGYLEHRIWLWIGQWENCSVATSWDPTVWLLPLLAFLLSYREASKQAWRWA